MDLQLGKSTVVIKQQMGFFFIFFCSLNAFSLIFKFIVYNLDEETIASWSAGCTTDWKILFRLKHLILVMASNICSYQSN